ncbi:OLC1v1034783C1 [Oldenlandia corymbosa var. corymbosa]|uniref:OLC1v1034783C1 n=1 Tax=Oldenlandia corymbosa var. corymbosa TaxID=529605 RepID=A0AAV1CS74_OLDCO|nr:OLC1v1034783C1 [Oldenlandia corymbosa var. corymbosa]
MAFAGFRRILSSAQQNSSVLRSPLGSIRLNSTLTSPNLFVSGLSRSTTDDSLHGAFSKFGRLVSAHVIKDKDSGRSKGFGFVTYETLEEAQKAREEMSGKFLDGWVIFVDPAKPRAPRAPPSPQSNSEQQSGYGYTVNKTVGWCG